MYNSSLKDMQKRFDEAIVKTEKLDDGYQQFVHDLVVDINFELEIIEEGLVNHPKYGFVPDERLPNGKEYIQLNKLIEKIGELKKEHEFYDAEAELDNMFPDRHDEGFDEDSMSPDSVFGDD